MCGIAGIVSLASNPINTERIKSMTDAIFHRGPDGSGEWADNNKLVAFGHRRLSIIDLSINGHQPMHYLQRYTITFNGEIYNYKELRTELLNRGYSFASSSDTEVLLALYAEYGVESLDHIDGMFSFAIWDSQEKTIFAARDRFGEKPFYYSIINNQLIFASEVKSLIACEPSLSSIDSSMTFNYLRSNYITNPNVPSKTFYSKIFSLPGSHYIKIEDGKIDIKKYWTVSSSMKAQSTLSDAADEFRNLFKQSVRKRMRSDVPIGSSLSGGLDSSAIVCMMRELMPLGDINTFSARFKNFDKDEGVFIKSVVDQVKANGYNTFPSGKNMNEKLDEVFFHQEEPFGSASILVQYEVFKLAKQHGITVLLDGQGADEILAGYHYDFLTYFKQLFYSNIEKYKLEIASYKELMGGDVYGYEDQVNAEISKLPDIIRYKKYSLRSIIKKNQPKSLTNYLRYRNKKKHLLSLPLESTDFMNVDFLMDHNNAILPHVDFDYSNLNSHLLSQSFTYGLPSLLRYADRNSMAHSREVRLPYLNHHLVNHIFSMPADYKINNGWTKYLMRVAFDNLMPNNITWRKDKIGFEPPQKKWLQTKEFRDSIMDARFFLVNEGILNHRILDRPVQASDSNQKGDNSWNHLMLHKLYTWKKS